MDFLQEYSGARRYVDIAKVEVSQDKAGTTTSESDLKPNQTGCFREC